jgi:hypothetical protein
MNNWTNVSFVELLLFGLKALAAFALVAFAVAVPVAIMTAIVMAFLAVTSR